jgi:hypothetical protein
MGTRGWNSPARIEAPSRWAGVALVAALVLALVGFAQTPPGRSLLTRAGLAGHAERYTALAFAAPARLPTVVSGSHLPLRFNLQNEEGATRSYQWTIVATAQGPPRVLAQGGAMVAKGRQLSVDRTVRVPCRGANRVRVSVQLAKPAEAIGLWVDCKAAP